MTYEEAMIRAKRLRERPLQAIVSGKVNGENNDAWLDIVADALYSASLPNELRCPRPINIATDHSMKWCKENGHCGCVELEVLRKEYGELVYPLNPGEGE